MLALPKNAVGSPSPNATKLRPELTKAVLVRRGMLEQALNLFKSGVLHAVVGGHKIPPTYQLRTLDGTEEAAAFTIEVRDRFHGLWRDSKREGYDKHAWGELQALLRTLGIP